MSLFASIAAGILATAHAAPARALELVSVRDGSSVAAGGQEPALSKDGRYVAFEARTGNVVPGDQPTYSDVFVRDRGTGRTERISVAYDGTEPNCDSFGQSISSDGRYVAYMSCATNLVRGTDTTWRYHVFVRDRVNGTTSLVVAGIHPRISGSGQYIAFEGPAVSRAEPDCGIDCPDIFVVDRTTGHIDSISVVGAGVSANGPSYSPSLSWDGRFVVYWSRATNLVPNDTNGVNDVFLYDRQTGLTERVSLNTADVQANGASYGRPSVSNDGHYVAFNTYASNFFAGDDSFSNDTFVRDRWAGVTELVSRTTAGAPIDVVSNTSPAISATGRFVAFESTEGDANQHNDVFLRNRVGDTTSKVSGGTNRACQHAAISGDGRAVAFDTAATNLDGNGTFDVYMQDRHPISVIAP